MFNWQCPVPLMLPRCTGSQLLQSFPPTHPTLSRHFHQLSNSQPLLLTPKLNNEPPPPPPHLNPPSTCPHNAADLRILADLELKPNHSLAAISRSLKRSRMPGHEVDMMIDEQEQKLVNAASDCFNSEYLKIYYGKLFPYEQMFKWMSYANDGKHPACNQSYFGRREFAFTLDKDDLSRYRTFNSVVELQISIKKNCPVKIDIGPVYNVDPAKRRSYAENVCFPEERELIFDIDISDYDDVRYCCSGADVCLECWPLMTIAIKVIDTALRDDFGFNHILWVFSGRRGVHCWVCDVKARRLTNEQRAAIADYFRVYKGNENSHKKVSLMGPALHPFLARSYTEVLKDFFERTMLPSQQIFSTEERYEKILDMIPDESVTSELRGKWQDNRRSYSAKVDINVARWEQLKHLLQSGKQKMQGLRRCVEEIVFSYTYPRLDMEVSKHMNHLLKAPFCVHPKTGRVCVPIDPNRCEEFDPTAVPTLSTLIEELNNGGLRAEADNERDRTSLGKSIRFFQSSFLEPLIKSCKEEMISSYNAKLQQSKLQQSKNVLAAI